MRGHQIIVAAGLAACAACTLTTPLDGYVGDPLDAQTEASSEGSDGPFDSGADLDAPRRDTSTGFAVVSLALVASPGGKVITGFEKLTDGAKLPPVSTKWSIRADVVGIVGSIGFDVDGTMVATENGMPYYMCGDDTVVVNACAVAAGMRTLRVTPYAERDRTGTAGTPLTLTVTVSP